MPKSCVALECRRTEGGIESYYKFPLQDKVRLKQWLANINVENFFPTKNQYLCSKHFKPSCFQVRLGVRTLKPDAVPTIFSSNGVAPIRTHGGKSKTLNPTQNVNKEICIPAASHMGVSKIRPLSDTLAIAIDPSSSASQMCIDGAEVLVKNPDALAIHNPLMGSMNLIPLVHIVESFDGLSLALAPSQGFSSLPIAVTGTQQICEIPLVEPVQILSAEQLASTSLQCDFYNGQVLQCAGEEVPTFIVSEDSGSGALVIENIAIEPYFEAGLPTETPTSMSPEDLMAYLETMQTATVVPALSTGPLPPLMPSPETVLSTSITRPIASTVPIVSKHSKEQSGNISEHLYASQPKETDGPSETLTTCELVSVVGNLQNKVKALQQRHKKHCSKMEVMEGVVEELKTENLISEQKVNLLELACLNSTPAAREDNEAIAIVCQEDDQTLMYSLPLQNESRTVYHITEQ